MSVKISEPNKNQSFSALAAEACEEGFDTIVAVGGDGTINAVASALAGNPNVKMGVIPRGTLNHFARDLRIPTDMGNAIESIISGNVMSVDVGEVNEVIFINNSSVGLYPALVRLRESLQKKGLSKWSAAAWAALRLLIKYRTLTLDLLPFAGSKMRATTPMLFVGNNTYDTSFPSLGTRAALDEGWLWITAPKTGTRFQFLSFALKIIMGQETAADALVLKAKTLTVTSRRSLVHVAVDGEVVRLKSPLIYKTRPKSLRVIVPMTHEEP